MIPVMLILKSGSELKKRKHDSDWEIWKQSVSMSAEGELRKMENLLQQEKKGNNGQATEEKEARVHQGEDGSGTGNNGWDEVSSSELLQSLGWSTWLDKKLVREELTQNLPLKMSMKEVLEKSFFGKTFGLWWGSSFQNVSTSSVLSRWIVQSSSGAAAAGGEGGGSSTGFGAIFKIPKDKKTIERRRDLLLNGLLWNWNWRFGLKDEEKSVLRSAQFVLDIGKEADLFLCSEESQKMAKKDGRYTLEKFIAAKFCATISRLKGKEAPASAEVLQRMGKDFLWIMQLFHLNKEILRLKEGGDEEEHLHWNSVILGLTKGHNSYTFVKVLLKQIDSERKRQEQISAVLPRVLRIPNSDDVIVDGHRVSTREFLPNLYHNLVKNARNLWEKLIGDGGGVGGDGDDDVAREKCFFFGLLKKSGCKIVDSMANQKVLCFESGLFSDFLIYNQFGKECTAEVMKECVALALRKVQESEYLSMWSAVGENWILTGKEARNKKKGKEEQTRGGGGGGVKAWLAEADLFLEILLVLFQIGGGGAARATELELLSMCNTVAKGQRTMFFIEDEDGLPRLVTLLSIPKTASNAGGIHHPIPRLMPVEVSELVLDYTVYLRKLHWYFTNLMTKEQNKGQELAMAFKQNFIMHKGKTGNAAFVRATFRKIMFEACHLPVKMSTYRHLAHFIGQEVLLEGLLDKMSVLALLEKDEVKRYFTEGGSGAISEFSLLLMPLQSTLVTQAGHSEKTGMMQYGEKGNRGASSHPGVGHSQLLKFLASSQAWHTLLYLTPEERKNGARGGAGTGDSMVKGIQSKAAYGFNFGLKYSIRFNSDALLKEQHICTGSEGDVSCLKNLIWLYAKGKGQEFNNFKSPGQKKAIEKHFINGSNSDVAEEKEKEEEKECVGKNNLLVVLPTGGGKTMVIQLSSLSAYHHYNALSGLSIVVTPLIALRNAQIDEFSGNNAFPQKCCLTWQNLKKDGDLMKGLFALPLGQGNLAFLFVTPEACQERVFLEFYRNLLHLKRVSRVYVDEAHNIVTSGEEFRPAYKDLAKNLQLLEAGIPFTLLSATIPKGDMQFKETLLKSLGTVVQNYTEVREAVVTRREISVGVVFVGKDKAQQQEEEEPILAEMSSAQLLSYKLKSSVLYFVGLKKCNILIYCGSKTDVEVLHEKLDDSELQLCFGFQVKKFKADLEDAEKMTVNDWWFEKENLVNGSRVLVCTTAFSEGLDHPSVNVVIHFKMSFSVINYFQEIGRLERRAREQFTFGAGLALFLVDTEMEQDSLVKGIILAENMCRWTLMAKYFDGEENVNCQSLGSVLKCDYCQKMFEDPLQKKHWSERCFLRIQEIIEKVEMWRLENPDYNRRGTEEEEEEEEEEEGATAVGERETFNDGELEQGKKNDDFLTGEKKALLSFMQLKGIFAGSSKFSCFLCKKTICRCFYGCCFQCGGNHFKSQCGEAKYPLSNVACFDCFMPFQHNFDELQFQCDKNVKNILLYKKVQNGNYQDFIKWYFSTKTLWKDRIQHLTNAIQKYGK
jgi:hypothetical protein